MSSGVEFSPVGIDFMLSSSVSGESDSVDSVSLGDEFVPGCSFSVDDLDVSESPVIDLSVPFSLHLSSSFQQELVSSSVF